ncbi:HAD family hydrolase [Ileibacterium valens]|uniref:Hydrolase n=1 Tax=Ileibacterium valens TaxID=1862668 RepID=A0A1U7NE95_9FIRM|nr:HAD family hydrolase [Ileibacterium valens]OLU36624.1 hydrolase [Erysipelotrichaceae bacterium NYU-BL-E8]OLU37829.1 hydrolase [Ileibacterium valens]OLU41876.1 hydrolase [Erysipelotrichaceae bacterium NYU-BL-F16]
MKHKIVFFDMDGTLFQTTDGIIQDSTLAAIDRLKNQGYLVAAATGRGLNMLKPILDRVTFDYYVLINGGYVLDGDFNEIGAGPIARSDIQDLVELAGNNDLGLLFHFGDSSYIYNNFYPIYDFMKYTNSLDGVFYDQTQSFHHRHDPYQAIVLTRDSGIISDFIESHPDLRMDLINVRTNGFAYDLFHAGNDKASGIETVLEREGLSWDDVIAFGDSTNDIRMLEKADLGIAMGSASDFVKSFANRTTTSVYANGIFNAVKDILAEEE